MDETATDDARATSEAADWFARLGARSVTNSDVANFDIWRRDPRNDAAYARIEALWRKADRLKGDPEIEAVAEMAIRPKKPPPPTKPVSGLKLPPATVKWTSLTVLACVAVALASQPIWRGELYATETGEQRVVSLSDGSQIKLDTRTRLRVRFTKNARQIELEGGQALFTVAHDAKRPFLVDAGDTVVRAVGTRFDVRRDNHDVRVVLVQGVVEVHDEKAPASAPVRLQAGEMLTPKATGMTPRAADIEAATGWTQGRIVLRSVPLSQAVAEVNRYSHDRLELEPGPIGATQVSGVFDAGDTEAFLAAVKDLHGLVPERQWNGALRLRSPPPSS
ncbi:MAG: FecR domain-containing protein [Phenylobacterium sp.]|uniref:FecR family protein n=1 Tax=Phenylobacterium sp. TaxID=1871053 RepID=UPI002717EF52|nr:FecR domain-containing protein [Phenylobacterium sp.]MDO9246433.1 FecR domain-containing protein [Phenylobacterium sp.]MDP3868391.1 FecR domain-containing protein [Phenylobacterium sp.]